MASFTRIDESETPSITIHPSHKIAKINDNIYGGFTEYDYGTSTKSFSAYHVPDTWDDASMAAY